jgi:hypothetical protein
MKPLPATYKCLGLERTPDPEQKRFFKLELQKKALELRKVKAA